MDITNSARNAHSYTALTNERTATRGVGHQIVCVELDKRPPLPVSGHISSQDFNKVRDDLDLRVTCANEKTFEFIGLLCVIYFKKPGDRTTQEQDYLDKCSFQFMHDTESVKSTFDEIVERRKTAVTTPKASEIMVDMFGHAA